MKLTLDTIKDFIDEIQFYEQIGYHKTADKLTKAITKLAYDFNASDMGYGPYAANLPMVAGRARLMQILQNTPECASLVQANNKQPVQWEDPRNCRDRLTQQWQQQNPGQQITPDALMNIQEQCMNAVTDKYTNSFGNNNDPNFMPCMEALSKGGVLGDFSDAFPNVQIPQNLNQTADPRLFPGNQQAQQPRNVPRNV